MVYYDQIKIKTYLPEDGTFTRRGMRAIVDRNFIIDKLDIRRLMEINYDIVLNEMITNRH